MIPLFKVAMNPNIGDVLTPVLTSGFITQGNQVVKFESELANYLGNKNVLTLNSATSGLTLAIRLLQKPFMQQQKEPLQQQKEVNHWPGLEPGDRVLTTALTCTATNWPILANGLDITWVDVDKNTGNLDLDDLKAKISSKTKIIMVVHWGGYPNDLDKINEIRDYCLNKYGFRPAVIEDCAHAFGAEYKGKKLGNHGNFCVFSFQAIKHLTTGDGGMIVVPEEYYQRAKLLRWYGIDRDARNYNLKDFRLEKDIEEWGYKFHMNDINATIGLANLQLAITNLEKHRQNAQYFFENLKTARMSNIHNGSWWIYSIKVPRKQQFIEYMKEQGITVSQVHNRNDNHSCVAKYKTTLPNLDSLENELVCIPCGWWLSKEELEKIVLSVNNFINV